MPLPPIVRVGSAEQQKAFSLRHAKLLEWMRTFEDRVLAPIFPEEWDSSTAINRFVRSETTHIVEDFVPMMLVCSNGEHRAGQRLLRPIFERVVTMAYLCDHPEKIQDFIDYYWVSQRKLLRAIRDTWMNDGEWGEAEQAELVLTDTEFEKVKHKFMVSDCKACGTKRLNHAWTQVDMVQMATKIGLGKTMVPGYYGPLQFSHPSMLGFIAGLEQSGDSIIQKPRLDADASARVLATAHYLMLNALDTYSRHFGFEGVGTQLGAEYAEIWKEETQRAAELNNKRS